MRDARRSVKHAVTTALRAPGVLEVRRATAGPRSDLGSDGDRARPPTRLRFEAKVPRATAPPPRAGRRPRAAAPRAGPAAAHEHRAFFRFRPRGCPSNVRHRHRPQRHDKHKDNRTTLKRHLSRARSERSIEHARDEFATRKVPLNITNKVGPGKDKPHADAPCLHRGIDRGIYKSFIAN